MDNVDYVLKNLHLSNCYLWEHAGYRGESASVIGCFAGGTVQDCTVENVLIGNSDGSANHVGGLFNGVENETALKEAHVKNVFARNINCYGTNCVSGFIEGRWSGSCTPGGDITIENCALVDSVVISRGGHSGGFVSCDQATGTNTYRNCYTNVDVYGTYQTGVFAGVTHQNGHVFENCYAAGKIEGTNTIGGFYGYSEPQTSSTVTFKNCYSTSMVGMSNGGTTLGGFAALGSNATFENCYAAGEVGTLKTLDSGDAPSGQGPFAGFDNGGGTYTNCYYDAQTTAMRSTGARTGVTAVSTEQLIDMDLNAGGSDAWTSNTGGYLNGNSAYPQLKVFAQGGARDKAYSEASASTVLLECRDFSAGDYDTVRHITSTFPLTNDTNTTDGFNHAWSFYVGKDPAHPQYVNESPVVAGTVPIITLSGQETNPRTDRVTSVAPGIGWLQVQATADGETGYRRLRLVPTSSIILASWNSLLQNNSDTKYVQEQDPPQGYRPLSDGDTKYDHRDNISFVVMDATNLDLFTSQFDWDQVETQREALGADSQAYKDWLQSYIDQVKASSGASIETVTFPKDASGTISADGSTLDYSVNQGSVTGTIKVSLEKLGDDGRYHEQDWTESLRDYVEGKTTADPGEEGTYRLSYKWMDDDGNTLKADGSKELYIVPPGQVHYKTNYNSEDTRDYQLDPGAYKMGDTVDAASIPSESIKSTRPGYTFEGFSTRPDMLRDGENDYAFDESTKVFTDPGSPVTNVYAIWSMTDFTAQISKDSENETVAKEGSTRRYHKNGDVVKYTIKTSTAPAQADRTNYTWADPVITDQLPAGLSLFADAGHPVTFTVTPAQGAQAQVNSSTSLSGLSGNVSYDAATRTITAKSGDLAYGGTGELTFYVKLNGAVPADGSDDVLGNSASVAGADVEQNAKDAQTPVVRPTPEPVNEPVPGIKKASENDAADASRANFTVDVWNGGNGVSRWENVGVTDALPEGMDLIAGSVKLYKLSGSARTEVALAESEQALAIAYRPGDYSYGKLADKTLYVKVGNIAGGEHYQLAYSVKVADGAAADALSNTAKASGIGGPDNETMEDSSTATLGQPVVWADKNGAHDGDDLYVGDEVTYRIRIQNYMAGSVWRGIGVADTLPEGLELVAGSMKLYGPYAVAAQDFTGDDADSAQAKARANMVDPADDATVTQVPDSAYDSSTRKITWPIGDVRGGQGYTFEFKVKIAPEVEDRDGSPYPPNWAYVGPSYDDPGEPGDGDRGWVGPSWGPADGGGSTPGSGPAGGFVAGDADPSSPTGGDGSSWTPSGGTDNWGNGGGHDGGFPEGYTPVPVKWRDVDATVLKSAVNRSRGTGQAAHVGDRIAYTVKVRPSTANAIVADAAVTDTIPEGLDLDVGSMYLYTPDGVKAQVPESAYDAATRTLAVSAGLLKNRGASVQTAVLTYECTVNANATAANTGNTAFVGKASSETVYPDGTREAKDPGPAEDLPAVDKNVANETRSDGATKVQDVLSYEVRVTNPSSTRTWRNAVLFDRVPDGIDVDLDSFQLEAPDGSLGKVDRSVYDPSTRMVSMTVGSLGPGQSYVLHYRSRVAEAEPEENPELITNSAWITADDLDAQPNAQASVAGPSGRGERLPQSGDALGLPVVAAVAGVAVLAAALIAVAAVRRRRARSRGAHARK